MDKRKLIGAGYVIIAVYVLYGIFFWFIPEFNPDEFWTGSRAVFFSHHGRIGEPMLPASVSPYFGSLFTIVPGSSLMGIIKTGFLAGVYKLTGGDIHHCQRIVSFIFSMLLCVVTFQLSIVAGFKRFISFLAVIILIITPEFFSQIHTERPELLVAIFFIVGLILFLKIISEEKKSRKTLLLIVAAVLSTLPCILVHSSCIVIPGTFGILYLIYERKNIISLNTILYGGISLCIMFWFYHILTAPAIYAESVGGGNFLKFQSPPIMRGLNQVILLPWFFYNKLCDDTILSRPVSLMFLLIAIGAFLYFRKRTEASGEKKVFTIFVIAIICAGLILTLLSGSYGNYLIVIYPLVAILLAYAINFILAQQKEKRVVYIIGIMFLFLCINFTGIQVKINSKKEFEQLNREVSAAIQGNDRSVVGMPLYYLSFTDRNYYSYGWLNPYVGFKGQSFAETIGHLSATDIIIDDVFVSKAYVDRGAAWTDSMFSFLNNNCFVKKTIATDYFMGKVVRDAKFYPSVWLYPEFKKSYLRKIVIYSVN